MNTKRSMTAVLIALVAVVTNTFAVLARPIEQPYVTPLQQNQPLTCQAVAAQVSQIDTPMRKADYDLLDHAAQCATLAVSKVHMLLVPIPVMRDNSFADFKEMQADQLIPLKTTPRARIATSYADFKIRQAEQMGE